MCSMQDDGGDHDGGRGLSDNKGRGRGGLALLFFLGFLGDGYGWPRWV